MEKPVVIVGLGALGSHVALFARNWGNPLKLADFDHIENKNVLSQFHTRMGLRRNKAQALQQTLQGLFGTKVEAIPHRLTDSNAEALLGGSALVIDCVDNAKTRRTIQEFVRKNSIPCLHGALSADGAFGRIVWDELFVADEEGEEGQATCEDGRMLPMFALVAAQVALSAQAFLEGGARRSFQVTQSGTMRLA